MNGAAWEVYVWLHRCMDFSPNTTGVHADRAGWVSRKSRPSVSPAPLVQTQALGGGGDHSI